MHALHRRCACTHCIGGVVRLAPIEPGPITLPPVFRRGCGAVLGLQDHPLHAAAAGEREAAVGGWAHLPCLSVCSRGHGEWCVAWAGQGGCATIRSYTATCTVTHCHTHGHTGTRAHTCTVTRSHTVTPSHGHTRSHMHIMAAASSPAATPLTPRVCCSHAPQPWDQTPRTWSWQATTR